MSASLHKYLSLLQSRSNTSGNLNFRTMATYDFSGNYIAACSAIHSLSEISESDFSKDASEIIGMGNAQFQIPLSDVIMAGFYQEAGSSSENRIRAPRHSAFSAYKKSQSKAAMDSSTSGETLHKRCFKFLKKIEEARKAEVHSSLQSAPAVARNNNRDLKEKKTDKAKSAFQHMIAERKRRVKLNEHFQNLYYLLPRNCKKDKHSILANATDYLKELKLRVRELEQHGESVDESIPRIFANSERGSAGFESHDNLFTSQRLLILYRSNGVILEQCDDIPCQVRITINVQMKMVSCSATLLLRVIELLRAEQLEIVSLSHKTGFSFQATFVVVPKGEDWDIFHWQIFGSLVSRAVN